MSTPPEHVIDNEDTVHLKIMCYVVKNLASLAIQYVNKSEDEYCNFKKINYPKIFGLIRSLEKTNIFEYDSELSTSKAAIWEFLDELYN